MKKLLITVSFCLAACSARPAIDKEVNCHHHLFADVSEKNIYIYGGQSVKGIKNIELHKEREGAYLVITGSDANSWGGPYHLLRLESKQWIMTQDPDLFLLNMSW
jgi:hypothetical protein